MTAWILGNPHWWLLPEMRSLLLPVAAIVVGTNALFAAASLAVRAVSRSGAAAGFIVSATILFFGGVGAWIALALFFLTASLAGRIRAERKKRIEHRYSKGTTRDAYQVLANGGVAALCTVAASLGSLPILLPVAVASIAEAAADTIASEIGVLSQRAPRSVVSGRRLSPGESGGVSVAGSLAAAVGSALIAFVWGAWNGLSHPATAAAVPLQVCAIWFSGIVGMFVDSLLGAALQAVYESGTGGGTTERSDEGGRANRLVRGVRWVNNDFVNSAGTLTAAVVSLLFLLPGTWPR